MKILKTPKKHIKNIKTFLNFFIDKYKSNNILAIYTIFTQFIFSNIFY